MTLTETTQQPAALPPTLTGIHHVGLTVRDVEASAAWYERVLRLQRQFTEQHHKSDRGGYAIVLGTEDHSVDIGLDHHPGGATQSFDPTCTGLDHLSFQVGTLDELHAWAGHLESHGVPHSGVYAMEGMPVSLLTCCDPDGIQLEFIVFHG